MKRWKYSLEELNCLYEKLVDKAIQKFNKQDYPAALKCIESAANFQYHINNIFRDIRLERLLEDISHYFYPEPDTYTKSDVVFFYDTFCYDNRCLTQQYIDALLYNKYHIVYILERSEYNSDSDIINLLREHDAEIYTLPGGTWKDKCDYLYSLINKYCPKAAVFQIHPSTTIPFISFYPFKSIIKYQINLTDHAFWLGSPDFFDYSFEFRNYGMTISLDKRGFHKKQLLLNPFYPWQSGMPFQGFPIDVRDKVVIFSGGAMYKIEGDNDMYYHLVKSILDTYSNVVLFYAGSGNSTHLEKFISDNKYEDRLVLLGNRKDIVEVFKNCDIYLSTYPIGGGLMSQLAAINAKPILLYKSERIENVICTKKTASYKFDTVDDFITEAGKLVSDKNYRLFRGLFFKDLILNQDDFRRTFKNLFLNSNSDDSRCYEKEIIDYDSFSLSYVDRINNNGFGLIEKDLIKGSVYTIKSIINTCLCFSELFQIFKRKLASK